MEGVFFRKKPISYSLVLLVCGLTFIGMYITLKIIDPQKANELFVLFIAGIVICLIVVPSLMINHGAFIHIDGDSIKAKYHWFGKIDCKVSDVEFAEAKINTLIIQLKGGKTHTITGVKNSFELCCLIRRNMSFEVTDKPEVLVKKLDSLNVARKKEIAYVISGCVLMFIIIFVTVFLTEGREFHEFCKTDWTLFSVISILEIANVIAIFFFARKAGKKNIPMHKLDYSIRRTIIETEPLTDGYVIAVYADLNFDGRVTVYGYPHRDDIYYTIQEFAEGYLLFRSYSKELEGFDQFLDKIDVIDDMIDITEKLRNAKS